VARTGDRDLATFLPVMLFGPVIGVVLGLWFLLRHYASARSLASVAGYAALMVLAGAVYFVAAMFVIAVTDTQSFNSDNGPTLDFEVRFPRGTILPEGLEGIGIDLNANDCSAKASLRADVRIEDGLKIVSGNVGLCGSTTYRTLVLHQPEPYNRVFELKLARNPQPSSSEFGVWQEFGPCGHWPAVAGTRIQIGKCDIRYRVRPGTGD
jgi:hypothetical protein